MPLGPDLAIDLNTTPNSVHHPKDAPIDSGRPLIGFLARTSFRGRLLTGVWLFFAILVALGIHGSSIPFGAEWWAPESHYSGYVFGFVPTLAPSGPRINNLALKELAMAQPRSVRSDEWLVTTPLALAQLQHSPRFPVVNTNIGDGQNMLINPSVPVWHPSLLARPVTWGYFLLGARRGLAWSWWFQAFSCFTALFLLLEIILEGRPRLAAFGAFWFCASAYVVCFSLLPAYYAFFPALMCVTAYYVLRSNKPLIQLVSGALLGINAAGFFMLLYPPWQIPLGYLSLLLFLALSYRDRLDRKLWPISGSRALAILIAIVIAGALIGAFLATCLPALKVMADTVYPGQRASNSGTYTLRVFFRGMYNLISAYSAPAELGNQSEASSFYYFFPPILLALALSRRLRSIVGIVGLSLAAYILLLSLFAFAPLPAVVAKILLLNYAVPSRTDIGFGLASIILSVIVLAGLNPLGGRPGGDTQSRREQAAAVLVSVGFALVIFVTGLLLSLVASGFPPVSATMLAALVCGLAAFCLLAGKPRIFCCLVGAAVLATAAFFNPLSTNLDFLYNSELALKITELNRTSDAPSLPKSGVPAPAGLSAQEQRPLWLCYGLAYPEVQVQILGGRALPGIQWPPQRELWRCLDPSGAYEHVYNRYAHVQLAADWGGQEVTFTSPKDDTMVVNVSPTNPVFASMGARYVLAMYKYQENMDRLGLPVIYKSHTGSFTIYGIPGQ
jgi:hypothetical protein